MNYSDGEKALIACTVIFFVLTLIFIATGSSSQFDTTSNKYIVKDGETTSNTACVRNYIYELYVYHGRGAITPDFECQSARYLKLTYGGEVLVILGTICLIVFLSLMIACIVTINKN